MIHQAYIIVKKILLAGFFGKFDKGFPLTGVWFLTFKGFNLMTPRLGTAFTFIIGRGHKESHGDLNKINRVKTNNKNVMKIPVISVIKKFLYSSLQYH